MRDSLMRRVHLFELEDQPWFPARLRAAMTSYLAATYRITPFPKLWAGEIARVLDQCSTEEIVDLGSGSGGPMLLVAAELEKMGRPVRVTLTDLYPSPVSAPLGESISYWPAPVNAACVPRELKGVRTMFASYHHFQPKAAHAILRDAFEQKRPICIFEATSRTPAAIASSLLIPLLVLALTPAIRPLSIFQIVFTYLPPVLPLLIFWDGFVSQLRTYTEEEFRELTAGLQSPEYRWNIGSLRIPGLPAAVPYLTGSPVN
jgi:hypothetical protein